MLLWGGCAATEEVAAPSVPAPVPEAAPEPTVPRVMGYHAYWTNEAWRGYPYDVLDAILFFDLEPDSTGRIVRRNGWPDRWLPMQRHAQELGLTVMPVVSIMDATSFRALFQQREARETLRDEILALFADNPDMDGIQLDFEVFRPVPDDVRSALTDWVRDLRTTLDQTYPQKMLSMFLLAFDEADVFDEAALVPALDFVVVQGYDLHGRSDEQAGPVAATAGWGRRNWRTVTDRFRSLGVPADKIVMGIPYFGYEWPTDSAEPRSRTRGTGVSTTLAPVDSVDAGGNRRAARVRAETFGLLRDAESGVPYYTWSDSTGAFQGWFDDEQSLEEKYRFVVEEGLRGVAIFPLAYGDELLAEPLRRAFGDGI